MAGRPGASQDFRCFCLPASGAIAVKQDLFHNGSISISNSSAGKHGGALLLSSSGVGTTWLWPAEDQRGKGVPKEII